MPVLPERGPNLNLFDHTPAIHDSPLFSGWRNPIPPEWFSGNKRSYTLVDQEALYGSLQFARSYGRVATETLSSPSDTAVLTGFFHVRIALDLTAVPGDTVASVRHYLRSASEITTVGDSAFAIQDRGSMVRPIVDIWP